MDNQREVNQALCGGDTLISELGALVRYNANGSQERSLDGGSFSVCAPYIFNNPQVWQIYTKPDWREELNGKETLCWVRDNDKHKWNKRFIVRYCENDTWPYKSKDATYKQCKRLTKAEIQLLMDSAPEVADE